VRGVGDKEPVGVTSAISNWILYALKQQTIRSPDRRNPIRRFSLIAPPWSFRLARAARSV
jgi:hypothetical protein